MKLMRTSLALAVAALSFASATTADARSYRSSNCKYVSKTGGAAIGAIGGSVLGGVLTHGSTGPLVGAAAGGVAGHEIARKNRNRNCPRYYRRDRR